MIGIKDIMLISIINQKINHEFDDKEVKIEIIITQSIIFLKKINKGFCNHIWGMNPIA